MQMPQYILFDYGETLACEPDVDWQRGAQAVLQLAVRNPRHVSAVEIGAYIQAYYQAVGPARTLGMECCTQQILRMALEFCDVELSVPLEKAERVYWEAGAPARPMPFAAEMLDILRARHPHRRNQQHFPPRPGAGRADGPAVPCAPVRFSARLERLRPAQTCPAAVCARVAPHRSACAGGVVLRRQCNGRYRRRAQRGPAPGLVPRRRGAGAQRCG